MTIELYTHQRKAVDAALTAIRADGSHVRVWGGQRVGRKTVMCAIAAALAHPTLVVAPRHRHGVWITRFHEAGMSLREQPDDAGDLRLVSDHVVLSRVDVHRYRTVVVDGFARQSVLSWLRRNHRGTILLQGTLAS